MTPAAEELREQYRLTLGGVGADLEAAVIAEFPPGLPTSPQLAAFIAIAAALAARGRSRSQRLTRAWYPLYRALYNRAPGDHGGLRLAWDGAQAPSPLDDVPPSREIGAQLDAAAQPSLRKGDRDLAAATSPDERAAVVQEQSEKAAEAVASRASKIARDGARRETMAMVEADREGVFDAPGVTVGDGDGVRWARATRSNNPCYRCLMIAGRGPMYSTESAGSFAYHDGCECDAIPVWSFDDYLRDPQFAVNRWAYREWQSRPRKTLSAWRSHIGSVKKGTPVGELPWNTEVSA